MAAEVRRTAAKGAHAVTFSENPSKLGWPSLHSDHWDPFWEACSDEGVVACMHIGSSSQMVDHLAGRAHRLPDHADTDQHRAGGDGPDLVFGLPPVPRCAGGPLRGRDRMDPLLPRAHRLPVQAAPHLDRPGLRGQAAERGLRRARADVLHRRPLRRGESRVPEHGQRDVGVRLPALRLDLAVLARGTGSLPRGRQRPRHRSHDAHATPCATSSTTRSRSSGGARTARSVPCEARPWPRRVGALDEAQGRRPRAWSSPPTSARRSSARPVEAR